MLSAVMNPPIPQPPRWSRASAPAIVLSSDTASPLLACAWLALHALLLAAAAGAGLPWAAKAGLAALVAAHAWRGWPQPFRGTIVCRNDGTFDLPDAGCCDLRLAARSVRTRTWVRLVLAFAADRDRLDILLARDQTDAVTWRALQSHLAALR